MDRVVVTGRGAVCPLANNWPDSWAAMLQGRSGIGPLTKFDAPWFEAGIVGEVRNFHPEEVIPGKVLKRAAIPSHYALVATHEAVAESGLVINESNTEDVGVIFGSAGGGYERILKQEHVLFEESARRVSSFTIAHMLPDASSGHIAIALGAKGPNYCPTAACATGTGAVGEAMETIRRGDAKAIICGGTDEPILPVLLAGFQALKGMATEACRPFDLRRDGFVVGEGAAALVLESLDFARARGARVYAEVVGYGSAADAFHMEKPDEWGDGIGRAMVMALRKADISPEEADYINAHGTGTPLNDKVETLAIRSVFGSHAYELAVSSTKSMVGHLMGGAGALEALATVSAINDEMIPPTINYETPDPECDLDYVPNTARRRKIDVALSNSLGLGGHNACVVFRKFEG